MGPHSRLLSLGRPRDASRSPDERGAFPFYSVLIDDLTVLTEVIFCDMMVAEVGEMWIIEQIIGEIRKHADKLCRLFSEPGQLVIHVNPRNRSEPVRLEVRVKV